MGNDNSVYIIFAIVSSFLFLLCMIKIAVFFSRFNRRIQHIRMEMFRSYSDEEYSYWLRKMRCTYLCLIPFVTNRNVAFVYDCLWKQKEETKKDGLSYMLAPSILGLCICMICLCGTSWAWFTATQSSGVATIKTGQYRTLTTVSQGGTALTPDENGKYRLEGNGTYQVEIKVLDESTATTGFANVSLEEIDSLENTLEYYTVPIMKSEYSDTFFVFHIDIKDSTSRYLDIIPQWGTCSVRAYRIEHNATLELRTVKDPDAGHNMIPDVTEPTTLTFDKDETELTIQ